MGYTRDENGWRLFLKHAAPLHEPGLTLLELGVGKSLGRSLVRRFALERGCSYFFADIRNGFADDPGFVRMLDRFSIDSIDDRFDRIVGYMMLHNVWMPWRWLPEVARVLKPVGLATFVVPVNADLNYHPVDCWRFFPDGMAALFEDAGLDVVLNIMANEDEREIARKHQIGGARVVDVITVGRKPKTDDRR